MVLLTAAGCKIERDFTMADGFNVYSSKVDKGFEELYYSAPFSWGAIDPKEKKIVTFTEGDINMITCDNKKQLIAEATAHIKFTRAQEGSRTGTGEWESLLKRMKAMKETTDGCKPGEAGDRCARRRK